MTKETAAQYSARIAAGTHAAAQASQKNVHEGWTRAKGTFTVDDNGVPHGAALATLLHDMGMMHLPTSEVGQQEPIVYEVSARVRKNHQADEDVGVLIASPVVEVSDKPAPGAPQNNDPYHCQACYRLVHIDTIVSNDLWNAVVSPTGDEGGLLCAACMADALAKHVPWAAIRMVDAHRQLPLRDYSTGPASLSHEKPDPEEAQRIRDDYYALYPDLKDMHEVMHNKLELSVTSEQRAMFTALMEKEARRNEPRPTSDEARVEVARRLGMTPTELGIMERGTTEFMEKQYDGTAMHEELTKGSERLLASAMEHSKHRTPLPQVAPTPIPKHKGAQAKATVTVCTPISEHTANCIELNVPQEVDPISVFVRMEHTAPHGIPTVGIAYVAPMALRGGKNPDCPVSLAHNRGYLQHLVQGTMFGPDNDNEYPCKYYVLEDVRALYVNGRGEGALRACIRPATTHEAASHSDTMHPYIRSRMRMAQDRPVEANAAPPTGGSAEEKPAPSEGTTAAQCAQHGEHEATKTEDIPSTSVHHIGGGSVKVTHRPRTTSFTWQVHVPHLPITTEPQHVFFYLKDHAKDRPTRAHALFDVTVLPPPGRIPAPHWDERVLSQLDEEEGRLPYMLSLGLDLTHVQPGRFYVVENVTGVDVSDYEVHTKQHRNYVFTHGVVRPATDAEVELLGSDMSRNDAGYVATQRRFTSEAQRHRDQQATHHAIDEAVEGRHPEAERYLDDLLEDHNADMAPEDRRLCVQDRLRIAHQYGRYALAGAVTVGGVCYLMGVCFLYVVHGYDIGGALEGPAIVAGIVGGVLGGLSNTLRLWKSLRD